MSEYIVTWMINIEDVDSPEEAAREALAIQHDRTSDWTTFVVQRVERGRTGRAVRVEPEVEVTL